jgi:hypothetical protein
MKVLAMLTTTILGMFIAGVLFAIVVPWLTLKRRRQ